MIADGLDMLTIQKNTNEWLIYTLQLITTLIYIDDITRWLSYDKYIMLQSRPIRKMTTIYNM